MTTAAMQFKSGIDNDEFNTNKQIVTNKETVAYLPFLDTSIRDPLNKT